MFFLPHSMATLDFPKCWKLESFIPSKISSTPPLPLHCLPRSLPGDVLWGRNECVTNEPQRTSSGRLGYLPRRRSREGFVYVGPEATISPLPKPATLFKLFTPYRSEKMYGNVWQLDCVVNYDYPLWGRYATLIKMEFFFPSIIQCSGRMLQRQAQSSLACVAGGIV